MRGNSRGDHIRSIMKPVGEIVEDHQQHPNDQYDIGTAQITENRPNL